MKRLHWPAAASGAVRVDGAGFHYLARVLRVQPGEPVELFDGRGAAYLATVTQLDADALVLTAQPAQARAERAPPAYLLQGLPKADKLEWVLQKATELGVDGVWPVEAKRSVVKLGDGAEKKLARWQRIADEAARQCGSAVVPVVAPPGALGDVVRQLPPDTLVLVLDEEERSQRLGAALHGRLERPVALAIGPEGGWTREELTAAVALGAQPVTLGARVLRTETAGLAALAVLRHLQGVLG